MPNYADVLLEGTAAEPHRHSGLATLPLWELSPSHPILV